MMALRIIGTIFLAVIYIILWVIRYKKGGRKKAGVGNFIFMVIVSVLIVVIWAPVLDKLW